MTNLRNAIHDIVQGSKEQRIPDTKRFSVTLSIDQYERLDRLTKQAGISKQDFISAGMDEWLAVLEEVINGN